MSRSEHNIMNDCLIALSKAGCKAFRHNVGLGWIGKAQRISKTQTVVVNSGDVVIRNARPLHAGLVKGGSDIIGWDKEGRFLAVEVKRKDGRVSAEQKKFVDMVNAAGGRAGIARSGQKAVDIALGNDV